MRYKIINDLCKNFFDNLEIQTKFLVFLKVLTIVVYGLIKWYTIKRKDYVRLVFSRLVLITVYEKGMQGIEKG